MFGVRKVSSGGIEAVIQTLDGRFQSPQLLQNSPDRVLYIKQSAADTQTGSEAGFLELQKFRQAQPLLKQGQTYLTQHQYAQAEKLFRQVTQLVPDEANGWLLLAEASEKQGKLQGELQAYRALVYAKGWGGSINSDPTTHMRYVLALCRNGDWQEAAQVFNHAMDASIRSHAPKAALQAARRGDANALAPYRNEGLLPLRIDPNSPDQAQLQAAAHYVLGTKHPSYGPPAEGEQRKHLQAAVRLALHWGEAQDALANALDRGGKRQEAQIAHGKAAASGFHDSLKEQMARAEDAGMRQHQLRFHPNEPERYRYHDPKMRPSQEEVNSALAALRARSTASP